MLEILDLLLSDILLLLELVVLLFLVKDVSLRLPCILRDVWRHEDLLRVSTMFALLSSVDELERDDVDLSDRLLLFLLFCSTFVTLVFRELECLGATDVSGM